MDAATIRFFNIPELAIRLPVHLTWQDISRLTRTNKDLRTWCTPALYFSIDLNYHHYKPALFLSTASTLALARNLHWVHQVEFHWFDLVYYFNCVLVYQDLRTQAGDPPPDRPLWLPPPDPSARPLSLVPPMTQLTRLGINFGRANSFDDCPYQLPSYNDPRAAVAQACWIIRSNPHLEELIMLNLVFRDKHDVRLLANSLFRLCNLRYLHLGLICDTEKVATFGTDISFGCPPSIEQLRIDIKHVPDARYCDVTMVYMNPWHHYDSHSDESDDDIAGNSDDNNLNGGSGGNGDKHNKIYRYYEKTTPRRKDPLLNLVDLWLWDMCSDAIDENLQSIYQHCPRVERISGPYLYKELMGTQDMVQLIGQGYTSIIFESESWQVNHRLPFKISVALPEQQLEEFRCDLKYGGLDETMARLAFQRHSTSLRRLVLQGGIYVKNGVLRVIFTTCVSLDSFEVSKDGNHGRLLIGLPDAVTSPWACTKIRHLELSIGMLKMFSFDSTISAPQFRECDPPNFITTNKEQQFELLEMFYRQIGSLTELTCLDLRVEWKLSDDSVVWPCAIAFKKTWFPALMALGDAKTDRPGYLHLLEGLGKLRELRGSFYVDTDEAKATMGEQEAAWVGLNWPCLKLAWFFHSRDSVRGPFKRLQDQRNQDSMDPTLRF